jgi:predicted  nucleic acid-binding Zn-ribbon protein
MSTNAVADREREVEQARTTLAEATERRDVLLADAEQLRRRLNDVEQQLRPTEAEVRSARRRLETAQRTLSQASERRTRGHRT